MKIIRNTEYDIKYEETDKGFSVRINGIPVIDASMFYDDLIINLRVRNTDDTYLRETAPFLDDEDDIVIDRRFQVISVPKVTEVY